MSDKPKARVRRKGNADQPESTARFQRKSSPKKAAEAPKAVNAAPSPSARKSEPLDLSAFEDDAFDLSMDDIFKGSVTKRYRVGDQVQGTVCGIQTDAILVDINAKSDGLSIDQSIFSSIIPKLL